MNKKIIFLMILALFAPYIASMTPQGQYEADLEAAIAQSLATKEQITAINRSFAPEEDEDLQAAIRASEAEFEREQASILSPGQHTHFSDFGKKVDLGTGLVTNANIYKIYQLALRDQQEENYSCGYRVLFIAQAISNLLQEGKTISSRAIQMRLDQNSSYYTSIETCNLTQTQLDTTLFASFMQNNNIHFQPNELFVLGRNTITSGQRAVSYLIKPYIPDVSIGDMPAFARQLNKLGQTLQQKNLNHPIHFIWNDSQKKHWVLISVVQYKNVPYPTIYYIDPKNVSLDSYVVAENFIKYVVKTLQLPTAAQIDQIRRRELLPTPPALPPYFGSSSSSSSSSSFSE